MGGRWGLSIRSCQAIKASSSSTTALCTAFLGSFPQGEGPVAVDQHRGHVLGAFSVEGLHNGPCLSPARTPRRSPPGSSSGCRGSPRRSSPRGWCPGPGYPAPPGRTPWPTGGAAVVCTTPPILGKLRYSSQWVAVSEEGFHLPSTFLPVFTSTSTMSSGESLSYSTPLGLMAIRPDSRSTPLTLPQVKVMSRYSGSSMLAWYTCSFNASSMAIRSLLVFISVYPKGEAPPPPSGPLAGGVFLFLSDGAGLRGAFPLGGSRLHLYFAVVDLLRFAGHQHPLVGVVDLQLPAFEDDPDVPALLAVAVEGGRHTAAQVQVPQAMVSPLPRSQNRAFRVWSSMTSTKPTFTRWGNMGSYSNLGPRSCRSSLSQRA